MKIKHLFFFLVVCQCKRESDMRPTSLTKGFKLIQSVTTEMNITLHGTMKINTNILFISLSDKDRSSVCNVTYDASSKTATMQSELSNEDSIPYDVQHDPTTPARFWLQIEPRVMDQQDLIQLHFEVESSGLLTFGACIINDFKNIHRLVLDGVHSISSLLFTFSE